MVKDNGWNKTMTSMLKDGNATTTLATSSSNKEIPFMVSLIAGGCAGTSVDVALFPIDTIKTRLQSPNGFWKAGGFRGIYNGLGAAALGSAPGAALFFTTYEVTTYVSLFSYHYEFFVFGNLSNWMHCQKSCPNMIPYVPFKYLNMYDVEFETCGIKLVERIWECDISSMDSYDSC